MALQELLTPKGKDEVLQRLLALLPSDFAVDDWHDGGVVRTLLELDAQATADMSSAAVNIAKGGFLETATGGWLDKVASNRFGVMRQPSVVAKYRLKLELQSGYGPENIQAGQLWVADASGLLFNNTQAGTLAQGGMLELDFIAEKAGAIYNLPQGTITQFKTPLPGLSVSNEANALLRAGADTEADEALRKRCRMRWALLGRGATADAYRYWALTASPSVDKVRVIDNHPRGQGTIDITIWGAGGIGADVVAEVNSYVQERRALNDDVRVYAAAARTVTFNATLYGAEVYRASALRDAQANLAKFQQGLDIGEVVYNAALIEQLMLPQGVENAIINVADTYVDADEVITLNPTLRWVAS